MTTPYILSFSSPDASLARAGGKGMNLAEMTRAAFPVPPGFIVTTDAYRAFVQAHDLQLRIVALAQAADLTHPESLERASDGIRALFDSAEIPPAIAFEISAAYSALARPPAPLLPRSDALPVAVRSSATAEDLPGLSFAGQQDTYLNMVGAEAVLDACKRCWASLWTARAIGYRARNGIAPDEVALAVVVQTMIPAEVSGVLFTANPLTGRRDEIVIDASLGLGEAIVSGQVEPDHYVVRPREWTLVERRLGRKALAVLPRAGGGTETVKDAGEAAARQALPDAQILELAQLAQRVADHYGAPQDLEWAWASGTLYLLQSRPITSLYPLPVVAATEGDREARVYLSANSLQGVVAPFTPMGQDFLQNALGGGLRVAGATRPASELIPAAGNRLFIDVTMPARDPMLRHILLAILERGDPAARQAVLALIRQGRIPLQSAMSPLKRLGLAWKARRLIGRALSAVRAPAATRARALAEADVMLAEMQADVQSAVSLGQLVELMEHKLGIRVPRLMAALFPVILPGVVALSVIDHWLVGWLHMPPGSALSLARGLPRNVTTEMDLTLWQAAQEIRSDAQAAEFVRAHSVAELVEAYRGHALPATAERVLDQFLSTYGMRATGEIDLGRPRWSDDPSTIVETLRRYLDLADPDLAPDAVFARGAAVANRRADELIAQVRETPFGALRALLLRHMILVVRELGGVRESPKFYIIRGMASYRRALQEHGRALVECGALDRAEDIFFIPLADLKEYAQGGTPDLKSIVRRARDEDARELARRHMPRLLLSTGEAFYEGVSDEPGASEAGLPGQPVSPGIAEGLARVVLDPRDAQLQAGEILVCPATDPGWTPLFLLASGLVMEIGGLVTHGSVVAREYGLPAVVGVHDATTRIHTGQRLRVDGNLGRVLILPDQD